MRERGVGGMRSKTRRKTKSLVALLKTFETDIIEYKEAKAALPQNIWKTISAFANAKGGVVVLGVKQEKNKLIKQGIKNPQKIIDDLISTISEKFNFCPVVKPEILKEGDKYFVTVEVEEALKYEKPIYIKDAGPLKGGYRRVGSVDQRLTDKDLQKYFQERLASPDAQILKDSNFSDIDKKTITAFKEMRKLQKVFYDLGWAETKGTGFRTTILSLKTAGYPPAIWENDEKNDTFTIIFPYPTPQVTAQVTAQVEMRDRIAKLLKFCEEPRSLKEMMHFLRLKHRVYFLKDILQPLLKEGHLARTIPEKPRSRFQKYVTIKKER